MDRIDEKFATLATDNAPGQEVRQKADTISSLQRGEVIGGTPVDFSHGDVDAFAPTPGARGAYLKGVDLGGAQAYTEYRGLRSIRAELAEKLADFTGAAIDADAELIITPGTQGALFLAIACLVTAADKVAVVQPDYFANRKLVQFFGGQIAPVKLDYFEANKGAGLDLNQLEDAFRAGVRVLVFSNPNNPAGVVYSRDEINQIAGLAQTYGATVIVDQLYSRLLYSGVSYTHLRATDLDRDNVVTIMGPSKTESLSGYRLGVAFGAPKIIDRMEKLQAIVSLRAAGYSQAVLRTWFAEPEGWLDQRIMAHQAIRDDLVCEFGLINGLRIRAPEAGSYLFPQLPDLDVSMQDFVQLLRHQAGVTVTPGAEFGPHSMDSLRLNFSQDHDAAVEAVERIAEMVKRYGK